MVTRIEETPLKILIASRSFYPALGGAEVNCEILARQFRGLGCEVKVVTRTSGGSLASDGREFPFEVIRNPSRRELWKHVGWCDVYLHNGMSLREAWPLAVTRRPWVVRHLTWLDHGGSGSWKARLALGSKRALLRFANSIAISRAVADHVNGAVVIPNPYRDGIFRLIPEVGRDKDLVFVGRLVGDKGLDVLLQALVVLKARGLAPGLTVIGRGPDEEQLRALATALGISEQVTFCGPREGEALARRLNEHQILVVPSRWKEPFGVVALEGIACGCVVVATKGGGLGDAVGPCGVLVANDDVDDLARGLELALTSASTQAACRDAAERHLQQHRAEVVAGRYLDVLRAAVRRRRLVDDVSR